MPSWVAVAWIALTPAALGEGGDLVTLDNGRVRVEFQFGTNGVTESLYAVGGTGPVLIARSETYFAAEPDTGDHSRVTPDYATLAERHAAGTLKLEEIPVLPKDLTPLPRRAVTYRGHTLEKAGDGTQTLTLSGATAEGERFERRVSLSPGDDFVRVELRLETDAPMLVERFEDRFHFMPEGRPEFTWAPQLKMTEETVFPDWVNKAPAVIVQKGSAAAALVADVDDLARDDLWRRGNLTLDLDVRTEPGPRLAYGLCPAGLPTHHTVFPHVPGQCVALEAGRHRFAYYLLVSANAPERQAHRRVVQFLWERFGHDAFLRGHAAQKETFDSWRVQTWRDLAGELWRDVERNGTPCGTILRRPAPQIESHFCAWWNNMRTAYGLALYARRAGDAQARDRATRMLNLALDAPRDRGAFPVLFMSGEKEGDHWFRDHAFGGHLDCYHAFDMAWTGYWLLKWRADIDPGDERILEPCVALGRFFLEHQRESGFIPSYFNEDFSLKEDCRLNVESAEPAGCAVFLAELHRATKDREYLEGAVKAVEYVYREIVPERKWFDYETFLSCSPKPYDFYDPITAQHPQNNMATIQMALACLMLFDATGERRFLEWGEDVLDQLSLTQQVWSHPRMTPDLIGGFTTQNTDAEWSDARQAYCAPIYLDYFERTGRLECLERGVAALRSGFAVAPYENWAHVGLCDSPGSNSGFQWGQGSAMATVEMVCDRYGDVVADLKNGWAYGINACTVTSCSLDGETIRMDVVTDLEWEAPARFVFRNVPEGTFTLVVNGRDRGSFDRKALEWGVEAAF